MNNYKRQLPLLIAEGFLILFIVCNPHQPEIQDQGRNIFHLLTWTYTFVEFLVRSPKRDSQGRLDPEKSKQKLESKEKDLM